MFDLSTQPRVYKISILHNIAYMNRLVSYQGFLFYQIQLTHLTSLRVWVYLSGTLLCSFSSFYLGLPLYLSFN